MNFLKYMYKQFSPNNYSRVHTVAYLLTLPAFDNIPLGKTTSVCTYQVLKNPVAFLLSSPFPNIQENYETIMKLVIRQWLYI